MFPLRRALHPIPRHADRPRPRRDLPHRRSPPRRARPKRRPRPDDPPQKSRPPRRPDPRGDRKGSQPGNLALSPDGTLLAWTLARAAAAEDFISPTSTHPDAPDRTVPVASGTTECTAREPAWSPDGATLSFLSTCAGADATTRSQPQISSGPANPVRPTSSPISRARSRPPPGRLTAAPSPSSSSKTPPAPPARSTP